MGTRFWIKVYIGMLDEPKTARLPDYLWRRYIELSMLAGREGNDGALPPVEEMAWILRLSEEKVLEDLQSLEEAGVVHLIEPTKWVVTNFAKQQTAVPVDERVRQYRERKAGSVNSHNEVNDNLASKACSAVICQSAANDHSSAYGLVVTNRYKRCNGGGEEDSNSTSTSNSESESLEEKVQEEGIKVEREAFDLPRTPREATEHPDVQIFMAVTGGRIPGVSQYQAVIEAVRLMRKREKLDENGLLAYLTPFWLAWSNRRRLDGRPYDRGNITWLTEWALNGSCPAPASSKDGEPGRPMIPSPEETRRMLAEKEQALKQAVPMPEEVRERIHSLARKKAGKEVP